MTSFVLPPAESSGSNESARVSVLKQQIGFDAALATERSGEYVALSLDTLSAPENLLGWPLERETVPLSATETMLRMRFARGDARITVRITAFAPQERQRVAARLIERADAVTHAQITDTRGPKDLGTLSLTPATSPAASATQSVYWIYRNIYAEVVVSKAPLDAIEVARAVQRQFVAATRPL